MKKVLAILLALMMVLVNVAALAESTDYVPKTPYDLPVTEAQTVNITKTYTVNNDEAETPAHTIHFTVTGSVSNITEFDVASADNNPLIGQPSSTLTEAPEVTIGENNTLAVGKGATEINLPINLPAYTAVGIYEYTIHEDVETGNDVAGITYLNEDTEYTLRVTVVQVPEDKEKGIKEHLAIAGIALRAADGGKEEKVNELENTYDAGTLNISKTVTGNLGNYDTDWAFTVTFSAPEDLKVYSDIYYEKITAEEETGETGEAGETADTKTVAVAAGTSWDGNKEYLFNLKHGESIKFYNIPKGVTYTIVETAANTDGYTSTVAGNEGGDIATGATGSIATNEVDTVAYTNDKGIIPDTGIELETLPFVLLMGIALVGVMALRRREDY